MLEIICSGSERVVRDYKERMRTPPDYNKETTLINLFTGEFFKKEISNDDIISENGTDYRTSDKFSEMLKRHEFKDAVQDIIDFGKNNLKKNQNGEHILPGTDLILFKKYTYTDVCRIMNWGKDINALNIGGYKYDEKTKTFPIFINYEKGEDVVKSQRYEDRFLSPTVFLDAPKSTDPKDGKNMLRLKDSEKLNIALYLFVRKNKEDEGNKEFYFLGRVRFDEFIDHDDKKFMIRLNLDTPVRHDLYEYLTSQDEK
jgi:hypothetical protein